MKDCTCSRSFLSFRGSPKVPNWLAVIILTPVFIWAAMALLELGKGE